MLTYLQGPQTGLWYAWNGKHTVNVQREPGGQDVDCFSIGHFKDDAAAYEEFRDSVEEMDEEIASGER